MTRQQAYELIKITFTQSFDKDRFAHFINELLNEYDQSKATSYAGQMVKHAFKEHVNHCHRLGTYTTPQKETIDILTVHLTKDSKLERARTAIRNYVAYHLDHHGKDAALVAFVSPSEKQWRFSYVKLEYKTVTKDSGRIATDTSLTPARRFSYIVGEGESCHTAQTRFVSMLENTQHGPSIDDIQDAFSVETVTDEFFKQYVVLFKVFCSALDSAVKSDANLHNEFISKNVNQLEYVKKLMGQIVFLYFLQRKGWLGVPKDRNWGEGPKNFLRKLINREFIDYMNFHNDVLQPLFYKTLATDRGHEAWSTKLNCRIPFLNGGLFEPMCDINWENIPIMLPNSLFTNTERVEEHVYGTGILDVFDRYNFTVNEAEPLEKEVAIDPEMLGKIFENLIDENLRKGQGTYYTPRDIVHYMCQNSLTSSLYNKLVSDNVSISLADVQEFIRIGDQAAFYEASRLSGKDSYPRELPESIIDHARRIDELLSDITVCDPAVGSGAFAVGMMNEIVRCRCALTPFFNTAVERNPYHFKRQAIQHSIYGVDIDHGAVDIAKLRLWLSLVVDEENIDHIKPLPNLDYKIVSGNSLHIIEIGVFNYTVLKKIELLKTKLFNETDHEEKRSLRNEIDTAMNEITGGRVHFDFKVYFSELFHEEGDGFDIVIANPPYINSRTMSATDPITRQFVQSVYKYTKGSWDIYIAFFELGFRILSKEGCLTYITPDKWTSRPFGDTFRKATTSKLVSLLKAGRNIFDSANVDAIVSHYNMQGPRTIDVLDYKNNSTEYIRSIVKNDLQPPFAYDWFFSNNTEILEKMESSSIVLQNFGLCENACATDDAYKLKPFIEEGHEDVDPADYFMVVNTGTIGKFHTKWGQKTMVYLGNRYLFPIVRKRDFLAAFTNTYGLKAKKQKLVLKGLNLLDVCLDESGNYIPGIPTLIITAKTLRLLKLLMAILNHPLAIHYIKKRYPSSSYNGGTTFTKDMINNLPLPTIDSKSEDRLIELVDQILVLSSDEYDRVNKIQSELNDIVYSLYMITDEERKQIETRN